MMIKSVVCMLACNKYPSSPLSGCIADAEALYKTVRGFGWEGPARIQFDDQVKNQDVIEAVEWFVKMVNTGNYTNALLCVSGHGTSIPAPGRKDPTRELFCPVDIDSNWQNPNLVSDEFFESQLNKINPKFKGKVKVDFFALCCNSGGLTSTQIDDTTAVIVNDPSARVRYLRNPWEEEIAEYRATQPAVTKAFNKQQQNIFVDNDSVWCYRSAANSKQYSYEVSSAKYGRGDVSRLGMLEVIKDSPNISYEELHKKTQAFIDKEYNFDQCPQLWAPSWRLSSDLFSAPTE